MGEKDIEKFKQYVYRVEHSVSQKGESHCLYQNKRI